MNKNLKLIVLSITALFTICFNAVAQDWELSRNENGIQAHTRARESGIKEVKVEATINASIEKIYNFITDYDNPKEWKHSTRSSKIVERSSENEFKVYFVIATPWPLKDRDFYADVSVNFTDGNDRCEIIFIPDTQQKSHGSKIRMTNFDTRWVLTEQSDSSVKVELYSYGDPVGVPVSFVNMFIVDTPFKTVQNLKRDIATYQ